MYCFIEINPTVLWIQGELITSLAHTKTSSSQNYDFVCNVEFEQQSQSGGKDKIGICCHESSNYKVNHFTNPLPFLKLPFDL